MPELPLPICASPSTTAVPSAFAVAAAIADCKARLAMSCGDGNCGLMITADNLFQGFLNSVYLTWVEYR